MNRLRIVFKFQLGNSDFAVVATISFWSKTRIIVFTLNAVCPWQLSYLLWFLQNTALPASRGTKPFHVMRSVMQYYQSVCCRVRARNEDELLFAAGMRRASSKWCSGSLTELVTISFRSCTSSVCWPIRRRRIFLCLRHHHRRLIGNQMPVRNFLCTWLVCRLNYVRSQRLCTYIHTQAGQLPMVSLLASLALQCPVTTTTLVSLSRAPASNTSDCGRDCPYSSVDHVTSLRHHACSTSCRKVVIPRVMGMGTKIRPPNPRNRFRRNVEI